MARHRWYHDWTLFSRRTLRAYLPSRSNTHSTHDPFHRVQEVVSRSISSDTEKKILRDARVEVGGIIFLLCPKFST